MDSKLNQITIENLIKHKASKRIFSEKSLTPEEIELGYYLWHRNYDHKEADMLLQPFLDPQLKLQNGWLRKARQSLLLSANHVADKLQVNRQVYYGYEISEEKGTISLATLSKAAEAMDCELVYAIRPKSRMTFGKVIWNKLYPLASRHPWLNKCNQKKLGSALAAIARDLLVEPRVRALNHWSKRKPPN